MLSLIVLGQIPGTNLHIGFFALLLCAALALVLVYGYKLYKTPLIVVPSVQESQAEETTNE